MMNKAAIMAAVVVMTAAGALAQTTGAPQKAAERVTVIQCGTLIDGKSNDVRHGVQVVVRGNRFESIGPTFAAVKADETIDLSKAVCLPGLIDTHTHIVLQGDIIVDYDEQLLKQSAAYRAIRAVAASQMCLEHGFTSIRDLETEGAGYTDVDLKKAINRGIVPGPRMQV